MFCKKCGIKLPDDALFCEQCGTPVKKVNTENPEIVQKQATKKIIKTWHLLAVAAMLVVIVFIVNLFGDKNLTFEDILNIQTESDVSKHFGSTMTSEDDDFVDITFMNKNVSVSVDYDGKNVERIKLYYGFEGMKDIESIIDSLSYKPTSKDIADAREFWEQICTYCNENYGDADIWNSPVNTSTYTWILETCEIEVVNYIENEDLSLLSAVDITINFE